MKKAYQTIFQKACLMVFLLIGINFNSQAQTVHSITNEGDALDEFIENTTLWEPGDIILLVSEGEYVVSDTIHVAQDITIMGDPELSTRPLLTFWGTGFMVVDSINITLKGFDANGLTMQGEPQVEHRANFLEFDRDVAFGGGDVVVEDIEAEGFKNGILLFYKSWRYYESLTVNNVIWHDFTEWAIDPRLNVISNLKVKNSTFYDMAGFLKNPYFNKDGSQALGLVPQNIEIDHNTFYNIVGPGGADALLQVNDPNDGQVNLMFTNNIVSTLRDAVNSRPFRINAAAGLFTVSNNVFHNFESSRDAGAHNLAAVDAAQDNIVTSNNLSEDPAFADVATADFTIAEDSPLMTASINEGPIGDPQWTDGPDFTPGDGVHRISNLEIDALDEFIENTALWNPGDTILLVSAGEYTVSDTIHIAQDITIMGDPRLSDRSLLTFWGTGFMVVDSINITLKGFDANGLTMQGEPQVEHRANFLEFDRDVAFGGGDVVVEDIEAEGFKNGILLFYKSWRYYESLTVNNVIWHDFTEWAIDPRLNAISNLKVKNSTFYDMAGFLKNPYFNKDGSQALGLVPQNIEIDHNTFYNIVGPGGADALLQVNDPNDGQVNLMFTNNIVSTLRDAVNSRPFRINAAAGLFTVSNNVFHNFESSRDAGAHNLAAVDAAQDNIVTSNNLSEDPAFADVATADFTIAEESPLMTAGTNEGPIGDPRWTGGIIGGGGDPMDVLVTEIIVAGKDGVSEITIQGGFLNMVATVLPGNATDRTVTWSVDDETLASITQEGSLVAKASGTVTVTATANDGSGISGSMEVVITNQANITSITVSTEDGSTSLGTGETVQMIATLTPENPDNPNVNWKVSDESLATISAEGVLTGIAAGTVTVTAAAEENRFMNGSIDIIIEAITGIGDEVEVTLAIYPNPVGNEIHIKSASLVKITISSLSGKVVLSETVTGDGSLDISGLPAGVYIAVLESKNGGKSLKIVKE